MLDFTALFDQLREDNYQGYVVYEGRTSRESAGSVSSVTGLAAYLLRGFP